MVGEAAHAEHDTGDHGSERGDQLIHEAEQGAHQAGDVLAGTVDFVIGAVCGHGDNDVTGDTLETSSDDGKDQIDDQEVAPVQSTSLGVGGHSGRITEQPQSCQDTIGDQTAHRTDQHSLALTQTGSKEADEQEAHDGAGDGHQTGNITLQQVGTSDAGEHGDHDGAGLCRRTQLIGRCGQDQHLNGTVVLQGIPVILQADLDRFAGAEELGTILGSDGDHSDDGEDRRHDSGHLPQGVKELQRCVTAHIVVAVGDTGNDDAQDSKHQGVIHTVERSEHGALFGIVGHTRLSRLGNDTLAGVAQVVDHQNDHIEGEAHALRQLVGDMESDVAGHAQDDLTDHDERAVLAELAVGLIDHEADERVSDTVPDTHHHGQGRSDHHANADPAHQVVGGVVHHHQINVGCGVVQRVACDTPQGNAVDAVVLIVLIIELIRQTSGFCHFILSFVHTGTFSVFSMGLTAATAYQPVRNFMSIL